MLTLSAILHKSIKVLLAVPSRKITRIGSTTPTMENDVLHSQPQNCGTVFFSREPVDFEQFKCLLKTGWRLCIRGFGLDPDLPGSEHSGFFALLVFLRSQQCMVLTGVQLSGVCIE